MSCMKRCMEDRIDALARKAGYTYDDLMDRLLECMSEADRDGVPFDYAQFEAVALEHDL